jgi:serine/threonine protein kinase
VSQECKDFVFSCLNTNYNFRPSAKQAMEFPWIKVAIISDKQNLGKTFAKNALTNLNKFNANEKLK